MGSKKKKTTKCLWCSKQVEVYKGRLRSHLHGAKKCIGTGQPASQVKSQVERVEAVARVRRVKRVR